MTIMHQKVRLMYPTSIIDVRQTKQALTAMPFKMFGAQCSCIFTQFE